MTIRVKYKEGAFKPVIPISNFDIKEGSELDIEIKTLNKKSKLKSIVGLFSDLSDKEIEEFEKAAKRRPLFGEK